MSCSNVKLNIGHSVQVLNKRKTGTCSNFGAVVKFHKQLVPVKLDKNESAVKRLEKSLLHKKEAGLNSCA